MSTNIAKRKLIEILVKSHPEADKCFQKVIEEMPEEKEFLLRLAKALKVKLTEDI